MLKVAVCWSGLTRGFTDAVLFNKKLFDDISSITNNEIEFDHFCQFWNANNKYLYDFDETLFDTTFTELDCVPTENTNHVQTIIDILTPKSTVFNDFNDMGKKILGKKFIAMHLNFAEYKTAAAQNGRFIYKTDYDMHNTFDVREKWGCDVHLIYCAVIKHISQFYTFEKVVSLAKASDIEYDIIIRMRYDIALSPNNMEGLITSMYTAKYDNSIILKHFELPEYVNNIHHNTIYSYNTNIQTLGDTGKKWCIDDAFFIGSAACMYTLANNIFDTSYTYYCFSDDKTSLHPEQIWFNEIYNKRIACNASDISMGYIILRKTVDLYFFKQLGYDILTYHTEYKSKLPEYTNLSMKLPAVVWTDPRRYFIPPNTYVLASMLKLILQY